MAELKLSLYAQTKPNYRKSYIPLESDPEIFNELIRNLGVDSLELHEVLSLDDPELLSFIPRPVLALIFLFPGSEAYDKHEEESEKLREVYEGKGNEEPVIWFAQTIHNACGLYATLHALSNGPSRLSIRPDSPLDSLLNKCVPLPPLERALALEDSPEIEAAHAGAAAQGTSHVPGLEDEVDYHYICFVRSKTTGTIFEMNGTKKGPVDTGVVQDGEDLLQGGGIQIVKEYIQQAGGNVGFSLMALAAA